ncbi:hypothetical protein HZH66_003832 [Vespula vulgaris]|uniref:Uncharacterized protein n=1 Tax=Vespula vulgaris TaxID=7454 RepID=A0A834KIZ4_VESVU|nr:hypothetical protein HZH66_003832 [Vespula vulgaris]
MTILSELISLADQLAKCNTLPLTFDATYQHPHSYRMIAMLSTKGYPISLRHSSVDAVDHLSPSRLDQILSLSTQRHEIVSVYTSEASVLRPPSNGNSGSSSNSSSSSGGSSSSSNSNNDSSSNGQSFYSWTDYRSATGKKETRLRSRIFATRQVDRFGDEAEVTARQCVEIYDCHCVLSASGSYSVECNRQTVDTLGSQERRDETPRTRVVDQGATPRAVLTLL